MLGPVLFLIYVDDISEGLTCKGPKFADDSEIMLTEDNYNLTSTAYSLDDGR